MSASNYVHITVDKIKRETEAAFLILLDEEEFWIPKSQIADPEDYEEGDKNVELSITEWIADQKGIKHSW